MTAIPQGSSRSSTLPLSQPEHAYNASSNRHHHRQKPTLLVLTSTYPRWINDHEPSFVHELASRLTRDFSVHVLAPHSAGAARSEVVADVNVWRFTYAPQSLELLVNNGGILTNLRRSRWKLLLVPGFLISLVWNTRRFIRDIRPDVLHAHWIIPQGTALSLASLLCIGTPPTLLTSHGADLYSVRSRVMVALKRWTVRAAARVTVVSQAMSDAVKHLGAKDVRVEPMGVNLRTLFVPPRRNNRSRHEILFVGRLVEKKGLRILIEAMPRIRDEHPKAFLTVVGFGPELANLQNLALKFGLRDCVNFVGPKAQSELPAYYHRAAVFVAPFIKSTSGDQEGLGLVVVEALGCACPVVVSDLPQVRQTLSDSVHATAVPPGCPDALSEAVSQQLRTTYDAHLHAKNAADVRARFDWDTVADRYASLLLELMN